MNQDFWRDRWAEKKIGFHEGAPNALLSSHIDALKGCKRVLVPLAGRAVDIIFLRDRGHEVVGVEFVQQAIDEMGPMDGITMVCSDFFAVTPEKVGTFDAIYDRAAMVAIDPALRDNYAATCRALLKPDAPTLLVAFAYDQSRANGPPWSLDRAAIDRHFAGRAIEALESRAVPAPGSLGAAGVTDVSETLYRIV